MSMKQVSEYDQEIPQSDTADTEHQKSQDIYGEV